METKLYPTIPSERVEVLDALRGVAIFGILIVNIQLFSNPVTKMLIGYTGAENLADKLAQIFIKLFFEGKFYVLFSMLFGYGFWIFMQKQKEDGFDILPVFRRRLFWLLMIGLIHVLIFWAGDILVFYAVLGFTLILFRSKTDKALLKWSVWLACIPALLYLVTAAFYALALLHPESKAAVDAGMQQNLAETTNIYQNALRIYSTGSFPEILKVRITEYLALLPGMLFFYPVVLAMFLLGLLAARRGLLINYAHHLKLYRKAFWWGLAIGSVANLFYVIAYQRTSIAQINVWGLISTFMHTLGGIAFCMVYISAILLLSAKGALLKLQKLFVPVGRMALSNYLLQSLICTTLFYSYGFGLIGKINAWQGIIISVLIFAIQIPLSNLWFKYFNYGPLEWLWRSLTYAALQPFRKSLIDKV